MPKRRIIRRSIERDDTVVLYPTFGHLVDGGAAWRIPVCGTVYERGNVSLRKRLLLRLLQRVMKMEPAEVERAVFEKRIHAFIAPTERGKRIHVRVGDRVHCLQKATRRNGRFVGTVRLTADKVQAMQRDGDLDGGWLTLDVMLPSGERADFDGRVQLIEDHGISVISDIDDTIKVSEVHSRRSLLANTFLREYRAIDGMAQTYRRWAEQGASFHYVSSSPWQLYDSLAELLEMAGFPSGTFHLRSFRLRDHMLRRLLLIRKRGKINAMCSLLRAFPRRRFVLVGDSGERDPEIYGALARKFSEQIATVLIRELPHRPMDIERRRKAFRRVPADLWTVFRSPTEIPVDLDTSLSPLAYSGRLVDGAESSWEQT